jgi:hypothetical protein
MSTIRRSALAVLLFLMTAPALRAQTDFSGEWTRVPDEDSSLNPDLGDCGEC